MTKIYILTFALLISCGGDKNDSSNSIINNPNNGSPALPIDENNEPSGPVADSESFPADYIPKLETADGVKIEMNTMRYPGTNRCSTSKLVTRVTYGGETEYKYLDTFFLAAIENSQAKEYLKCSGKSLPGTYQHAVTSVMAPLKKIEKMLDEANIVLEPIEVSVLPLLKLSVFMSEYQRTFSQYRVNNASYYPSLNLLQFLPMGVESSGKVPFSRVPLYNIPFVPAHEYGHHIFKEVFTPSEGSALAESCFTSHRVEPIPSANLVKDRNTRFLGALNEGFADLIGKLVVGSKKSFVGVGCFDKNRNVSDATFIKGDSKLLNSELFELFKKNNNDHVKSCDDAAVGSIHHFGAVLAHASYKSFLAYDSFTMSNVINWLKAIKSMQVWSELLNDAEKSTLIVAQALVEVIGQDSDSSREDICIEVAKNFPLFSPTQICN